MKDLELLEVAEQQIKEAYNLEDATIIGHSINSKKIKFTFQDAGMKITTECDREFFEEEEE